MRAARKGRPLFFFAFPAGDLDARILTPSRRSRDGLRRGGARDHRGRMSATHREWSRAPLRRQRAHRCHRRRVRDDASVLPVAPSLRPARAIPRPLARGHREFGSPRRRAPRRPSCIRRERVSGRRCVRRARRASAASASRAAMARRAQRARRYRGRIAGATPGTGSDGSPSLLLAPSGGPSGGPPA